MGLTDKYIQQNILPMQMVRISIRDFLGLSELPCDVYGLEHGEFKLILHKTGNISSSMVKDLILLGHHNYFVLSEDLKTIINAQTHNLLINTRSLSIGDSLAKASKQLNLLTINLRYLYNDPSSDELLKTQLQAIKNLAKFLIPNHKLIGPLIEKYVKNRHHYLLSQPMISSIFLVGILKRSALFSDREIENLFITSYFKDIGMATVPEHLLSQGSLSTSDTTILQNHSNQSEIILKGRIGITNTYMEIIKNHHTHSLLGEADLKSDLMVDGIETMIISIMDIISAMTSERPYRKATALFDALYLIKPLMADKYSHEYRWIVKYFKNLFENR